MSKTGYLIIAIAIIVFLVAVVVLSYIGYRKIPAPSGVADVHHSEEKCAGCAEISCPIYAKYHQEEKK